MTFEPTSISLMFDDVIVQNPPARCVNCEHSLVTWSAPLRGDDESDADPFVAEIVGPVGDDDGWLSHPVRTASATMVPAIRCL
jgi:hypothetical protein